MRFTSTARIFVSHTKAYFNLFNKVEALVSRSHLCTTQRRTYLSIWSKTGKLIVGSALGGLSLSLFWNELHPTKQSHSEDASSKHPDGVLYDFVVIGGGVCGIASLYGILSTRPQSRILLVEKDAECLPAAPRLRGLV